MPHADQNNPNKERRAYSPTINMTSLITPPPEIPRPLAEKLSHLRRGVTGWLALDGIRRLLTWIIGLLVLDLAVDYLFHLDITQRVIVLLLLLGLLAYVIYRDMIVPLQHSLSDDSLALEVEHR